MSEISQTLADWIDIETIDSTGFIRSKQNHWGFVFALEGIHGELLTNDELWQLHHSLRNLIRLEKNEEVKIVFRKRADISAVMKARFSEIDCIKNKIAQDFYRQMVYSTIEQFGFKIPLLFSTQITFAYSVKVETAENSDSKSITDKLNDKRALFYEHLQSLGANPKILDATALLKELSISSRGIASDILQPEWPKIDIGPSELKINQEIFRSLHLTQLPEDFSEMGMIQHLLTLPIPLDIALKLKTEDAIPLKKNLEKKKNVLFAMERKKSSGDPVLESRIAEIQDTLTRLHDQNDGLTTVSLTIGLRGPENAPELLRSLIQKILQIEPKLGHLELRELHFLAFDSFLELLPWGEGKNLPEHTMLISNAIHFLPLFSHEKGANRPVVSFSTRTGMPYFIDPVGSNLANYNWMISGTSGAGKSFFVNSLLTQSLPLSPKIFIVDIGGSYRKLTKLLGGKYYDLKLSEGFRLGPFFSAPHEDPHENRRRKEQICMIFLEMCRDDERPLSVEEKAILNEKVSEVLESKLTVYHPIKLIQNRLTKSDHPSAKRLALLLERWTYPSFFGEFLDTSEAIQFDSDIIAFDLKGIEEFPDLSRVVQFIICASIWQNIRNKQNQFSFIVLDEVAFSLLRWQPQFVDELVSTLRKYHAGAILVVQDLEKITGNSAGASILQNTQFKAILQQRGDPKNYREPLGLDSVSVQAIQSLQRKKGSFSDIFLSSDHHRVILRYAPSPLEYALATSDPVENQKIYEQLEKNPSNNILNSTIAGGVL